jgi:hypothetical protein
LTGKSIYPKPAVPAEQQSDGGDQGEKATSPPDYERKIYFFATYSNQEAISAASAGIADPKHFEMLLKSVYC